MSDVMRTKKQFTNRRLIRENSITETTSDVEIHGEDIVIRPKVSRFPTAEKKKPVIIVPSKRSSKEAAGAGTTTADSDTASLYLHSDGSVE